MRPERVRFLNADSRSAQSVTSTLLSTAASSPEPEHTLTALATQQRALRTQRSSSATKPIAVEAPDLVVGSGAFCALAMNEFFKKMRAYEAGPPRCTR